MKDAQGRGPDYENLKLEELNYESYLRIPSLLELQREESDPPHHDEMFFIVIHQAAELWFKLILHETETVVSAFRRGSVSRAIKTLRRIRQILELQVRQIKLLDTLTPVEFAGFRDKLAPASGFQSVQFRKMEFSYGLRDRFFLKFFQKRPEVVAEFEEILEQPSVYDEFVRCLHAGGHKVPTECLEQGWAQADAPHPGLVATIRKVYEDPRDNYHWVLLFETMVDVDEKFALWRSAHILMVERTIGKKRGTGGSAGHRFLQTRLHHKFFPELWEVRNVIGSGSYGSD